MSYSEICHTLISVMDPDISDPDRGGWGANVGASSNCYSVIPGLCVSRLCMQACHHITQHNTTCRSSVSTWHLRCQH